MFPPIFSIGRGPGIKFSSWPGIHAPPIISLRRGPGIKFLHSLGVDVPAYIFSKVRARHKSSS